MPRHAVSVSSTQRENPLLPLQVPAATHAATPATDRYESRRPLVVRFKRHLETVKDADPDIFDPNEYNAVYLPWFMNLSADDIAKLERAFQLAEQLGESETAFAWVYDTTAMYVVNLLLPDLEARVTSMIAEMGPAH